MRTDAFGPVWCPLISPYRLSRPRLREYLRTGRALIAKSEFRSLQGWSAKVASRLHEENALPEDWSVLPLRSGTDSLMLALKAAHVGPGDTVAVPDMAFEAVAMTVLRVGAKPVVLDLDGRTWNLAESNLVLPRGRPPKAVIAVDNFGSPCDWQGIAAFCKREGVTFILDSCEALGAAHAAGPPSSFADLVVYSFSYTKPIHAAGAGGALCARSELIDDVQRRPDCAAWSARLAELNAAHLVYAWPDLSRSVTRLNEIYGRYRAGLEPLGAVTPEVPVGSKATWMIAPFRFPKDAWDVRPAELISWLWQHRIEGRRAFPLQSERFSLGPSQKTSRALYDEIVCLPTGAGMPLERVQRVIDCLAHAKQSRPAAPAVPLG